MDVVVNLLHDIDGDTDTVGYNWSSSLDGLPSSDTSSSSSHDEGGLLLATTTSTAQWTFLPLAAVPLWILAGNFLVLTAVLRQRSLRTLSNWVIASLALTDFLLALIVVPLGVYQQVRELC